VAADGLRFRQLKRRQVLIVDSWALNRGLSFRENLLTGEPQHPERGLLLRAGYARAIVKGDYKYIANRPPNIDEVLADLERDRTYAESTGKRRRVGWQGGERPEAHRFRKGVASTNDRRC